MSNNNFVHLHNHSEYSLLDGAQTVDEMASRAAELGMPAMAITDHGRMGGVLSFYNACHKHGIKPILGMEAYITGFDRSLTERVDYMKLTKEYEGTPKFERSNYHLILLCKNYEGYRNLCMLSRESYGKGFYRKPRIDYPTLEKYHDGLIASSACIIGQVSNLLLNNDYDGAKRVATWMRDVFGEDYYLEIMNHGLDIEMKVMQDIRRLGRELDIPVIATNDDHYTRKEDHNLQKTLMLTGMHKSWADNGVAGEFFIPGTTEVDIYDESRQREMTDKDAGESDPIFETPAELYIKNYDEMLKFLRPNGGDNGVAEQELANTLDVAEKCNCELPLIDPSDTTQYHTPIYNIPLDLQYNKYKNDPTHDEIPEHTSNAIIEAMHADGANGNTLKDVLSEHEYDSLKFVLWICKNNFDKLIKPKVEARGKPLAKKFWIENPPEGFEIIHAHNSPDEQWLDKQFAAGKTKDDIYKEYWDRLDYELGVVCRKHFIDYFEIVQQYANYTRISGGQIGPGRGSGCGSLLNYLIGITAIDPLPNGLLFARFLNPDRNGYPDIDLDFTKDFRDNNLWPYLREQYGRDNTSQIATYQFFWGKAAIRTAARVLFQKPESLQLADDLIEFIDDKPKLDLNDELDDENGNMGFKAKVASDLRYQQIVKLALMLQGRVSGESQHASAYIVSPDPLVDRMPLMVAKDERERSQKENVPVDNYLIQLDGRETQDYFGYVKLDLLCIADLDVMRVTLDSIKNVYGCKIDIENIPLDDKEVFDLLQDGYNAGIFQFDGSPVALRILQASGADCIADWSAISALNRPGPLQMGYDVKFIKGKKNPDKATYFSPYAEQYLKETYSATVYQEQLMFLSQDKHIVGFTAGESDNMRKILAHKDKAKIQGIVDLAHERASENDVPENIVNEFCDIAVAAGNYSFNKSHSLAYALIGYRGAFLKCHFPDCFLAAMCALKPMQKGKEKIPDYLDEARQLGVIVKSPHVNYSMETFSVPERGVIAFGLSGIKRVGVGAGPIIAEREKNGPYKDFTDFCCRVPREVGKTPLEALIHAGALDGLGWSRMAMEESIDEIIAFRKQWFAEQERKDIFTDDLFGGFDDLDADDDGLPDIELVPPYDTEYSEETLMRKEKEQFGMYFNHDPRDYSQVSRYIEEEKLTENEKKRVKALRDGDTNELARIAAAYTTVASKLNKSSKYGKSTGTTDVKSDKPDYSRIPHYVNIGEISDLPDKTPVVFIGNVQDLKQIITKSGKPMGNGTIWDNGKKEESRHGFSPVTYSVKITIFNRVWLQCVRPLPDDVVKVIGRVNVDPDGRWDTAVLVDDIEVLPHDSEWLNLSASEKKLLEYKAAREAMDQRNASYSDPSSSEFLIPSLEFRTIDDMESFKLDPDLDDYRGDGRVQITVAGDKIGAFTEMLGLKQTRGMVRFAARYGATARKIRLPKAQRAINRNIMMHGDKQNKITPSD